MIDTQDKLRNLLNFFKKKCSVNCNYYSLIFFLTIITGCSEPNIQKFEGPAQGTTYHISYWSDLPVNDKAIEATIKSQFEIIDKTLSNYRPDSVIELFNSNESTQSRSNCE